MSIAESGMTQTNQIIVEVLKPLVQGRHVWESFPCYGTSATPMSAADVPTNPVSQLGKLLLAYAINSSILSAALIKGAV